MKNGIFLLLILLITFGCTEPFSIHTDDSLPVPVIYSALTDELRQQEVMITRSSAYFDNQPNVGISNAEVVIQSSDNETFIFIEKRDSIPGLYVSENAFAAHVGTTYALSVEMDFDGDGQSDHYEATTTILPALPFIYLDIDLLEMLGRKNYILWPSFQDPPEENYLMFHVFHNDSSLRAKISNALVLNDKQFNGQEVRTSIYRFDDISRKEQDSPEQQKRNVYWQPGDHVEAAISLIPKGYFDFVSQCQKEMSGENPMFGGPASNITTNISNGGVGYFVGYCVERTTAEFH